MSVELRKKTLSMANINKCHEYLIPFFVGQPNHHWLSDTANGYQKFLGIAQTAKSFPLVVASRYGFCRIMYMFLILKIVGFP